MHLTLDSSVIVAALREQETYHAEALRVLDRVRGGHHTAIEPLTVLVEVGAAIRRRTGSRDLALRVAQDLRAIGFVRFLEVDGPRAVEALDIACEAGVRGMDAVVVQVAREFGTGLVSLDFEMVERVRHVVTVVTINDAA